MSLVLRPQLQKQMDRRSPRITRQRHSAPSDGYSFPQGLRSSAVTSIPEKWLAVVLLKVTAVLPGICIEPHNNFKQHIEMQRRKI